MRVAAEGTIVAPLADYHYTFRLRSHFCYGVGALDGTVELARLADLLRLGAVTARRIAGLRPSEGEPILGLADRVEQIANELDEILDMPSVPCDAPSS